MAGSAQAQDWSYLGKRKSIMKTRTASIVLLVFGLAACSRDEFGWIDTTGQGRGQVEFMQLHGVCDRLPTTPQGLAELNNNPDWPRLHTERTIACIRSNGWIEKP
jgi:hypothetical protein